MEIAKVPDVGQRVVFEGHEYIVVMHRRGRCVLQPVNPTAATFKKVTCRRADLLPTEAGQLDGLAVEQADAAVARHPTGTLAQRREQQYQTAVIQRLRRKKFETENPWVLPFRHIIRSRHWAQQLED